MKNPIQISIPQPCNENWNAMTPVDKGRFCASCQKNVVDFTRSSDREVLAFLKQNDNVCGRFFPNQLERELHIPEKKGPVWTAAAVVAGMLSLGTTEVYAQTPPPTEQRTSQSIQNTGKPLPSPKVTGNVKDMTGLPVPGAVVENEGNGAKTISDDNGDYSITAAPGDTIIFSMPFFSTQRHVVHSESTTINVILEEPVVLLGDVAVTAYRTTTRRKSDTTGTTTIQVEKNHTFFGRIFHSIGNLFR